MHYMLDTDIASYVPASQRFTYLIRQPQAQKALFYNMTTKLVQQMVQITASHDLTYTRKRNSPLPIMSCRWRKPARQPSGSVSAWPFARSLRPRT